MLTPRTTSDIASEFSHLDIEQGKGEGGKLCSTLPGFWTAKSRKEEAVFLQHGQHQFICCQGCRPRTRLVMAVSAVA